jgi:pimeloyl-ACP methyl ester carboxylesterase
MGAPRIGRVDGLAFEVAGSGPPLLLLHEGVGDRGSWDPHWDALCERFTTIRYDQRGFGESADPVGPYALHEDALTVLGAAGFDRAAVMGVSLGGAVSVELALEHPAAVERAVLVSTTPDGHEAPPDLVARWEEVDWLVAAGDLDAANEIELQIWVDGVGRDPAEPPDPALRAAVAVVNRALLARQGAFEHRPSDLDPAAVQRLAELTELPLLLVTGAHDQPMVHEAAAAITGATAAERVDIAGAAHLPHLERPVQFREAVLGFLTAG